MNRPCIGSIIYKPLTYSLPPQPFNITRKYILQIERYPLASIKISFKITDMCNKKFSEATQSFSIDNVMNSCLCPRLRHICSSLATTDVTTVWYTK